MVCQKDSILEKVWELYEKISKLESLKPSEDVDMLFTQLVNTCIPPYPIDVTKLCKNIQEMRSKLIRLCGEAEGLLEKHYSTILGSFDNPLDHLNIFPYFNNYLKLGLLEFNLLTQNCSQIPKKVAFIGSGPLPLTSVVLASYHLTTTTFHNYDIDSSANTMASTLITADSDLSGRMFFHTTNIMDVTSELKEYDVVFLAALVGMDKEEKVGVIEHLGKYMAPGAILMLRSAHGARAFLYPVVDPADLQGFEILTMYHPTDEVINSVVISKKYPTKHTHSQDFAIGSIVLPTKCSCAEIQAFNPLGQMNMIEELTFDEQRG